MCPDLKVTRRVMRHSSEQISWDTIGSCKDLEINIYCYSSTPGTSKIFTLNSISKTDFPFIMSDVREEA